MIYRKCMHFIHDTVRSANFIAFAADGFVKYCYSYVTSMSWRLTSPMEDDVIKWKQFPRYWPFVRGIHRSPGNSPNKGQWRGALMFSLIYVWINGWVNNREGGDKRSYRAHYDIIVMWLDAWLKNLFSQTLKQHNSCAILTICKENPLAADESSPHKIRKYVSNRATLHTAFWNEYY